MIATSLASGTPAWRAARAAACLGALLTGRAAADDVLGHLRSAGEPEGGWWTSLEALRAFAPHAVALRLPRPGDPRGVSLPRDVTTTGLVGWCGPHSSHWLIPHGDGWLGLDGAAVQTLDPAEADRALREAIVHAAHEVDVRELMARSGPRESIEGCVAEWIDAPPPLPGTSRELAGRGLRMLLGVDAARTFLDVEGLERAARSAVEAAYTTVLEPRAFGVG